MFNESNFSIFLQMNTVLRGKFLISLRSLAQVQQVKLLTRQMAEMIQSLRGNKR